MRTRYEGSVSHTRPLPTASISLLQVKHPFPVKETVIVCVSPPDSGVK